MHLNPFKADKVFVVCNGELAPSARESLQAMFQGSPRSDAIEFFGLDRIWELTVKHFGPNVTWNNLLSHQGKLLEMGGDAYRLEVQSTEAVTTIQVFERYPGASEKHPIGGQLQAQFPNTPDGRKRLEDLQKAMQGEVDFSLSGEEILSFTRTGALASVFD